MAAFTLASPSFEHHQSIPKRYTCVGEDVSPPLAIAGIPKEAKSLVLIMDDPDAPMGTWDHWVMWNLPLEQTIPENTVPNGAVQGKNSWGKNQYGGPCPPSGTHRYFFKLYALDTLLELPPSSTKSQVEKAMQGHILAKTELMGTFAK